MIKDHVFRTSGLPVLLISLLAGCQTTYSALPKTSPLAGSSVSATAVPAGALAEEPEGLVASAQPHAVALRAPVWQTEVVRPARATGLQTQSPDTLPQQKHAETPRKFGVAQGAHIAGGLLILGGGAAVLSGVNSDSSGYYPLAAVGFGIILAIIGGAMLLFKGKTSRRRQKQA